MPDAAEPSAIPETGLGTLPTWDLGNRVGVQL